MSVYKSRRKDASAQFIADARELRRMTARAVKRFPSSYRYIVTNGLLEMAREIVVNAVKGNAVYLHKDLSQGDFDLRHRYLKMAEVTADAYLEEITFAFSLVDDGNSFFKNKAEYQKVFNGLTSQGNTVLERLPQAIVVAASGMAGLGPGNAIRTEKVGKRLYLCGDGQSDVEEAGSLFAPRVMLCAGHQALAVLRVLAGELDV